MLTPTSGSLWRNMSRQNALKWLRTCSSRWVVWQKALILDVKRGHSGAELHILSAGDLFRGDGHLRLLVGCLVSAPHMRWICQHYLHPLLSWVSRDN